MAPEMVSGWDWLNTPAPSAECVKPEHLEAVDARERFEDLLASIWLYVPWRFVTMHLTTPQKEVWADAIDAFHARANVGDPELDAHPVERWWRDA